MSWLEDRLIKIIELRKKGLEDLAIADELDLSSEMMKIYEGSARDAIKKISKSYSLGVMSRIVGLSAITIEILASAYGIRIRKEKNKRKKSRSNKGGGVDKYNLRDRLIRRGISPKNIAKRFGVTRQAIDNYVKRTNQSEKWRQSRYWYENGAVMKEQQRNQIIGNLLLGLIEKKLKEAGEEEWITRKALEYCWGTYTNVGRNTRYNFEDLLMLFKSYYGAQKIGEKISFRKMRQGTNIKFDSNVKAILNRVGLESMRPIERHLISKEWEEKIKNSVKIEMPCRDLAYFLDLPDHILRRYIWDFGLVEQRPITKISIKNFGREKGHAHLTHRLASQIYEAYDAGFKHEETAYLLDVPIRMIEYAIANRNETGDKIIRALKILCPGRKIENPYKDFKD